MRVLGIRVAGVPGFADFEVSPGSGIVGWIGEKESVLRHFLVSLGVGIGIRAGPEGAPDGWEEARISVFVEIEGRRRWLEGDLPRLGDLGREDVRLLWSGAPPERPETAWCSGTRLLARLQGGDAVEACLRRLGGGTGAASGAASDPASGPALAGAGSFADPGDGSMDPERSGAEALRGLEAELDEVARRLEQLQDVPARLQELEGELAIVRADAAEAGGDLEVVTMEWLRERQDAETTLNAYRDRARELLRRIEELEEAGPGGACPYCGRALAGHHDEVMAGLKDDWEALVQDGTWWRRRWEQLESKPSHLRELEVRAVALDAALEASAERLERCRFELRRRDELRAREAELRERLGAREGDRTVETAPGRSEPAEAGPDETSAAVGLLDVFRAARRELHQEARDRLARRAGALLNRMSGGSILGLRAGEGELPHVIRDGRAVRGSDEDAAALGVALHLATFLIAREAGVPLDSVLLTGGFERMDRESQLRAVELLRDLEPGIPQVLLLAAGPADAFPEGFDRVLDFTPGRGSGGGTVRSRAGGVGRIVLAGASGVG